MKLCLQQISYPNPEMISAWVSRGPGRIWLDSALGDHPRSRRSIVAAGNLGVLTVDGSGRGRLSCGEADRSMEDPYGFLEEWLSRFNGMDAAKECFTGGALGFLSYESYRRRCRLSPDRHGTDLPELYFLLTDTGLVLDHERQSAWVFSSGIEEGLRSCSEAMARERIRAFLQELETAPVFPGAELGISRVEPLDTRDGYLSKVQTVREAILRGDCYQVNLSQKFMICGTWHPADLYLRLRTHSPASHMAFLNLGDAQILSASPEVLLETEGPTARSYPIKGTRPRGAGREQDQRMRMELLNSPKDAAELLMIVDLVRNDLGKVCEYGSIHVPALQALETLPQVHHLVATVEGRLRRGISPLKALLELSPGGSVTGAPKLKAMEIINGLEEFPRGIYTGSIGYLGFNGRSCFNICIRTALLRGDALEYWAGGGIVADSNPESEYRETLDKAEGLFGSLGMNVQEEVTPRGKSSCRD
jgi:para-aminobenzoate synthetase component 1